MKTPRGLTLIELLVAIAIVGILVAILIPAVGSARESARRTHCVNQVRQLALAVTLHDSAYKHLPSNGWGWLWIGEPGRGSGRQQPGGWIYQTLPFLEQSAVTQLGGGQVDALRKITLGELTATPIPGLRCPSRPSSLLCPRDSNIVWHNAELVPMVTRSDYVGNAGSHFTGVQNGPETLAEGDSRRFAWPVLKEFNGIFRQHVALRTADITDGLSHTYLLGEKHVSRLHYDTFGDFGYDQPAVCGDDWDLVRWTHRPPLPDGDDPDPERFGSVHPAGLQMAMADGSVHTIAYSIDSVLQERLGNRHDGQAVTVP